MSVFAIGSCRNNETKTSGENSDTTDTNAKTSSESGGNAEAVLSGTQPDTTVSRTGTV
jgi:hypothetical protein